MRRQMKEILFILPLPMEMLLLLMDLQVVKNVATQSLEVKKLVYLYLLHYAEKYVDFAISFPISQF